jgi:hypothetical protein
MSKQAKVLKAQQPPALPVSSSPTKPLPIPDKTVHNKRGVSKKGGLRVQVGEEDLRSPTAALAQVGVWREM